MVAILDKFGRIVIPQKVRQGLGLNPGDSLEIEEQDGQVVIRPVHEASPLRMKDGVLVYYGKVHGDVTSVLAKLRAERNSKVAGFDQ